MAIIRLKVIRLSGKTKKLFRQHEYTKIEKPRIAGTTAEEVHDKQDREGRLETENVPLQPIRKGLLAWLRERWGR